MEPRRKPEMEERVPSRCKSCGAKITWAKTEKGKNIPLDFPGEMRLVVTRGNTAVTQMTYISHFATCPNAAEHRKPRGE